MFAAPTPKRFGRLQTENRCIICTTTFPHKLGPYKRNSNFRFRLHHLNVFGSSSSHIKLPWLWVYIPDKIALRTYKMISANTCNELEIFYLRLIIEYSVLNMKGKNQNSSSAAKRDKQTLLSAIKCATNIYASAQSNCKQ